MSGKTAELYKMVFQFIELNFFKLEPAHFMTDFEGGLRKAINEFYPNAVLSGCWYHYCAALRRKHLSLKMYELITDVPAAKKIYRMMLSLPLLPKETILDGYTIIRNEAVAKGLGKKFKGIFDYFDQYWLFIVSVLYIHNDEFLYRNSIHKFYTDLKLHQQ